MLYPCWNDEPRAAAAIANADRLLCETLWQNNYKNCYYKIMMREYFTKYKRRINILNQCDINIKYPLLTNKIMHYASNSRIIIWKINSHIKFMYWTFFVQDGMLKRWRCVLGTFSKKKYLLIAISGLFEMRDIVAFSWNAGINNTVSIRCAIYNSRLAAVSSN